MEEMKLYDKLATIDIIIPPIEELLKQGMMVVRKGKIYYTVHSEADFVSQWVFSKRCGERDCDRWMKLYFAKYRIVPRGCFNCWKVVVRPRTLKELFEIRKLQVELGFPGKCGVDNRPASKRKGEYAAFWYCPFGGGVEGAREHHKVIEREVHKAVGFQTPVILKRACTEMEDAAGETCNWVYPERQHILEDLLDSVFEFTEYPLEQPWFHKVRKMVQWIEKAIEIRDPTVGEFFDLSKLDAFYRRVKTVTYHDEIVDIAQKEVSKGAGERISELPEFQGLSDYL